MTIKKHIPNILSTIRFGMALALPFVFIKETLLTSLLFYLTAAATDAVDGTLARKWKVQSAYGKLVDPIADKLLNGIMLIFTSIMVNPLLFILTGLEASIAAINAVRIKKRGSIDVSKVGKVKTVVLFLTLIASMLTPMVPQLALGTASLMTLTAGLQIVTAGKYFKEYCNEKKEQHQSNQVSFIQESKPNQDRQQQISALQLLRDKLTHQVSNNKPMKYDNYYTEEVKSQEDLGISRTLRK